MYELPTAPRNTRGVLEAAFELFKQSFAALLPLTATATVIGYAPLVWMVYSGALDDPLVALSLIYQPRVIALVALVAIFSAILYAAMLLRADAVAKNRPMSTLAALGASARLIGPLLVASLVYWLVVTIGFVLVVPGLILMQSLIFYLPAIALDHKGAIESLTWSHELVWGHWWRTAGVFGLGVLLASLVVYAGAAIGLLLAALPLAAIAVQACASLVAAQFMIALWLVLYRDLGLRREAKSVPAL